MSSRYCHWPVDKARAPLGKTLRDWLAMSEKGARKSVYPLPRRARLRAAFRRHFTKDKERLELVLAKRSQWSNWPFPPVSPSLYLLKLLLLVAWRVFRISHAHTNGPCVCEWEQWGDLCCARVGGASFILSTSLLVGTCGVWRCSHCFQLFGLDELCKPSRREATFTWGSFTIADIDFISMALVRFLYAAERNVVEVQRNDPQIRQGGCRMLFWLCSGVCCHVDGTALWSSLLTELLIPVVVI